MLSSRFRLRAVKRGALLALSFLVSVALFVALSATSASAARDVPSIETGGLASGDQPSPIGPLAAPLASPAPPFHEGMPRRVSSRRSLAASGYWGGTFTTPQGAQVRIYASPWWRQDNSWLQGWAGFFDGLYHGSELSSLTLVFLPLSNPYAWDIVDECGPGAAGCYDPAQQTIYAPGNHLPDGTRMETVIAHEYGHHIAANRSDAPWDANAWGPKRWASQLNICARTQAGQVFPGDEGAHYTLNAGEGFAEAYRLTVQDRGGWTGWPRAPWSVVDPLFMPDYLAEAAVRSDVVTPWNPATPGVQRFSGKLTKKRHAVMLSYPTMLDGDVTVRLFRPYRATLTLLDQSGAVLGTRSGSFTYTVCGSRSMRIRLSGAAGSRYLVEVTTP